MWAGVRAGGFHPCVSQGRPHLSQSRNLECKAEYRLESLCWDPYWYHVVLQPS